jgi:hypothetical protein
MEPKLELATKTFLINGKEVEFTVLEVNEALGHTICLINVIGKKYWDECKKVFTIKQSVIDRIDSVFND